jgi:hypothetical protein
MYKKDFDYCKRKFFWHTKKYPSVPLPDDVIDEIAFWLGSDEGGTVGEMTMVWYPSHRYGAKKPVAQLQVFEDAFGSLSRFVDVISALGEWDDKLIQPHEFRELLLNCGFEEYE